MINIDMTIDQNYAKFTDPESGLTLFVDSFDNIDFNVRIGTIEESKDVGKIIALTNKDLQSKLTSIFQEQINTH